VNAIQERIYRHLVADIVSGRLALNDKLLPERELSRRFGTTRMNVHYAVKELKRRGIVARNRKGGTWVARTLSRALERQLKGETAKRICVIRSRDPCEYLHWNDAFLLGLGPPLYNAGYSLESTSLDRIRTRQELRDEMKRLADLGMSAFILSVRTQEDHLLFENTDILFQHHRNIFVYQTGALDWTNWPFHTVTVNFFGEGRIAVEHLIGKGCQRIAYCEDEGMVSCEWNRQRHKGACFGMHRATDGQASPEDWIGLEDIYRDFVAHGRQHALIAAHDPLAIRIIDYFAERGLQAGKDYKIIGVDNSPEAVARHLTSIAPPHQAIGRLLGQLIISSLDGKAENNTTHYMRVDSEVIERDTA
jgi:DNA-binding LacI/PurR family transcriptional regulator